MCNAIDIEIIVASIGELGFWIVEQRARGIHAHSHPRPRHGDCEQPIRSGKGSPFWFRVDDRQVARLKLRNLVNGAELTDCVRLRHVCPPDSSSCRYRPANDERRDNRRKQNFENHHRVIGAPGGLDQLDYDPPPEGAATCYDRGILSEIDHISSMTGTRWKAIDS